LKETVLVLAVFLPSLFFFLWCVWTTNPKHPKRLDKLREKLGVNVADNDKK
jgi:hypothetical protein